MNKFYTTEVLSLLETANKSGVIISYENDKLNVNVLKGKKIAPELIQKLKENKEQLIQYFKKYESKDNTLASITDLVRSDNSNQKDIPLSYSQESLWFIDQLEGSIPFHIPAVLRLNGLLNFDALSFAFNEIINRHEVLRTVIKKGNDDYPKQELLEKNIFELAIEKASKDSLQEKITQETQLPFELSSDHMIRAKLLQLNEHEHILVIVMHHIAADGWSMPIIVEELIQFYESKLSEQEANLLPLPIQYANYAQWQRKHVNEENLEQKLLYWENQLKGVTPLNLTTDFPRPAIQSKKGNSVDFQLNKDLSEKAKRISQQEGTTLFMTLLTAFKVMLYKYTGQDDICVGTSIANRTQKEIESLIGYFVNLLALRSDLSNNPSFIELLKQVKETTLDAYVNQEVPFDKVVQRVEKNRDQSRSSVFQVLFTMQNTSEIPDIKLGDLIVTQENTDQKTVKYDLTFTITENGNGLNLNIQYCSDLFSLESIERMMGHYQEILSSSLKNPNLKIGKLNILTRTEESLLLSDFSTSSHVYPKEKTVIELFEKQVEKTPDHIALIFEEQSLTFKEFNEKANQLAHYLRSNGVKEESLVSICMERSMEVILAIMGVVKAGAAFVPIDPEYPQDRINYIINDTGSQWILSNIKNKALINPEELKDKNNNAPQLIIIENTWSEIQKHNKENPAQKVTPENLIYMIYTSGSTGRPKGVMLEHGNLMDHLFDMITVGNLKPCKSFALTSSVAADGGHSILFASFLQGSTMHILSDEVLRDSALMKAYIEKYSIDCMKTVPSLWSSYADDEVLLLPNETLILGGEAFSLKIVEQLRKVNYKGVVYNNYGPTETTIGKLMHIVDVQKDYTNVPIGIPLSNTQLYVVNAHGQLCPIGVPGELWIGGDGVSRGYMNREELTREKFIQNPFSIAEGRVYKSGDFVKWLPDGNIEFLGRIDHQVQIRGYRVELGEIETVLQQSSVVSQGVVLANDDQHGNKRLIAYVVPEGKFNKEIIQEHLKAQLPDYMVPQLIIEMNEMPLTTNAKVDKRALPDPNSLELQNKLFEEPRNETEERISKIWCELLKIDKVGINDNFFEMGGHSLLATRVVSAIRKTFEIELPIKALFANPNIASLAKIVKSKEKEQATNLPQLTSQNRPQQIPLSFSQERLWFIDKLEGSIHYHVPTLIRFKGDLNIKILTETFQTLVNRHEVLRTVFKEEKGKPYQKILEKKLWEPEIIEHHISDTKEGINTWVKQEISKPFDLSNDHMLRAQIVEINPKEHLLLINIHHIASDGWSVSVFVKEFIEIYEASIGNRGSQLIELPVQYADFAIWQRENLKGDLLDKKLDYWYKKLENVTPLNLPTDFARPAIQSTKGNQLHFIIDKGISNQANDYARRQGATLFMTLLSVFKVLMYRYTGQEDICIGSPIANRTQKEVENLVGFFVNTLALRSDLSGNPTFKELLNQVKNTTLEAYAHQDVPFERIVEKVEKVRDRSRNPIFQVMFILQNTPETPQLQLGDLQLEVEELENISAKFDLIFNVVEESDGLDITIEYCTDLFLPESIEQLMKHYLQLLSNIIAAPNQPIGNILMLNKAEENLLLNSFNQTTFDYSKNKTVIDLFEQQVIITPNETAIVFEETSLSYLELNERANQLSHFLNCQGLQQHELVGISLDRSIEMIVGILAIMKSGGTYVPMDPDYPKERLQYILNDTKIKYILSKSYLEENLPKGDVEIIELDRISIENAPAFNPIRKRKTDTLGYIIFTSGSTGRPKGVQMGNRALVNMLEWQQAQFKHNSNRKVLQFASLNFDVSFQEIFSTICFGSTLHLIDEEGRKDALMLLKKIEDQAITHLFLPFVVLDNLTEIAFSSDLYPKHLKEIITAGEQLKLTRNINSFIKQTNAKLINQYGPSESHVVSAYEVTDRDYENRLLPPIGKPINNTQLYVLDANHQFCGLKITGELYIGGDCLSSGYINNYHLTNDRFLTIEIKEQPNTVYKTGDLVRWLPDGNLEYIGRSDDQVKIRGHRVELGEIESVLQKMPNVVQNVVIATEDVQRIKRLIAYIVINGNFDKTELENYLRSQIPDYMVPSVFIELKEIPVTNNGKVDKRKLPQPDKETLKPETFVAARNPVEKELNKIWAELLQNEKIGVYDNFFELGGHSLLATRVVAAIRSTLKTEIPLKDLFNYPTIALLAEKISTHKTQTSLLPEIKPQRRPDKIPLSFSQERLWFIDQLEGSSHYHMSAAFRLNGNLDINLLEASLNDIINRHEILRTVLIQKEDITFQEIKSINWKLGIHLKREKTEIKEWASSIINRPFNLSEDTPFRADILSISPEEFVLVLVIHHIASDGWSVSLFVNELVEIYKSKLENRSPKLEELPLQYADYAIFQRNYLKGEIWDKKLSYWTNKLNKVSPLNLPTDYSRGPEQSKKGALISFRIEKDLSSQLQQLSNKEGATLYMTLLTAFKVLLYKYTGQDDICVGSPIANRTQKEVENLIGFFVNTLALRSDLKGNPNFKTLLQQVKNTTLEAYENQEIPFEKIVHHLEIERNRSRSPLFQVLFVMQNNPESAPLNLGEIEMIPEPVQHETSKFDLSLNIAEDEQGMEVHIEYCSDLFKEATIERMFIHFNNLLNAIVKQPKNSIVELSMLSTEEERQLLIDFNSTTVAYPKEKSLHSLIEEQAKKTPNKVAIVIENQTVTYEVLDKKANQMAHYLINQGVKKGGLVGICMDRSSEMVMSMLAILKSGAAYVPIDPHYPQERVHFILKDAQAQFVISQEKYKFLLSKEEHTTIIEVDKAETTISQFDTKTPEIAIEKNNLAYVIYTSGSTGKPKGVMISHANVTAFIHWCQDEFKDESFEMIYGVTSICFDLSIYEIFYTLSIGKKLRILENALDIKEWLSDDQQIMINTVPSVINTLISEEADFANVNVINMAGEPIPISVAESLDLNRISVRNLYGPSEDTTYSTFYHLRENQPILIGKPIANTQVYILDAHLQLVPLGAVGELCIGGEGISKGYLYRENLTAEKFIKNPFHKEKDGVLYKTGDLARWLPNGQLEYLGRKDEQVKIRGFRIEPGEIENIIAQFPEVKQCVVLTNKDNSGNKQLVTYLVSNVHFEKESLKAFLREQLPEYMLPSQIIEMEELPMTPNGKVNKTALASIQSSNLVSHEYVAPRNESEEKLVLLWQKILQVEKVGVYDDFFESGGHSLLATRLATLIHKEFSMKIPIKALFQFTNIAELSNYLQALKTQQKAEEEEEDFEVFEV